MRLVSDYLSEGGRSTHVQKKVHKTATHMQKAKDLGTAVLVRKLVAILLCMHITFDIDISKQMLQDRHAQKLQTYVSGPKTLVIIFNV